MIRTSSEGRTAPRTARRARPSRRGLGSLVLVVAAFGLTACGNGTGVGDRISAAAVVGDDVISVQELQSAYSEINEVTGGSYTQQDILAWLMLEPLAVVDAADQGVAVSEDDARAALDQGRSNASADSDPAATPTVEAGTYSDATIAAVRGLLAVQNVGQQLQEETAIKTWYGGLLDQLEAENVEVSPRYGGYVRPDVQNAGSFTDLLALVGPADDDWFADQETPSPEASPEPTLEDSPAEPAPTDDEPSPTATP